MKFAAPDCAPITTLGGGSGVGCATSVSTPLVAGVVGLLRALAPFATADDLERALAETDHPVAGTRYGLVDAAGKDAGNIMFTPYLPHGEGPCLLCG